MPENLPFESPFPWDDGRPDTVVIMCVDGRWRPHVQKFVTEALSAEGHYDILAVPGGIEPLTLLDFVPKDFNFFRRRLESLIDAHGTRRIVAVAHQDCAWYKTRKIGPFQLDMKERQLKDLRRAARWLRETFTSAVVETYYARLTAAAPPGVAFDVIS